MNKLKDNTMTFIVNEAIQLFFKKSIAQVTMSDIAKEVGIGEATLYRYFKKKQNIVLKASVQLAQTVFEDNFPIDPKLYGFDQLKSFYTAYFDIYTVHPEYYKFVNELDAYLLNEDISEKGEYESSVDQFFEIFNKAYETGLTDGTVKPVEDIKLFYYATTHSLLSFCKYLSTPAVLVQDVTQMKGDEIKVMINLILDKIRK